MARFTEHTEPWGEFVDVKINAPVILEKQLLRARPGRVMISSVCDGWQPLERKYKLSRVCLELLLSHNFPLTILTKSSLVARDFDLMSNGNVQFGMTLTTLDETLRQKVEPFASSTLERIRVLREAASKNIKVWAFLGPFMPLLSDNEENLSGLFASLANLDLEHIYADKLNMKPGLWVHIRSWLVEQYPYLLKTYGKIFFSREEAQVYRDNLRQRILLAAEKHGLQEKLRLAF
jgi:DNA repair photolyase